MAKGYTLNVALNKVNKQLYGTEARLNSCINNARAIAAIGVAEGYWETTILFNEKATIENFTQSVIKISKNIQAGDTLLISFSGHGHQARDLNGDEPKDDKDEAWCFYDGFLIDDNIYDLWKYFNPDVRIIVIADNCHSGSIIKGIFDKNYTPQNVSNIEADLPAIILISSCHDDQESQDGRYFSRFVNILLETWNWGQFEGNYIEFVQSIGKTTGFSQQPGIITLGKNTTNLLKLKPFKL